MTVTSVSDNDVSDALREATEAFLKAVDKDLGDEPLPATRVITATSAAVQLILAWRHHESEALPEGDEREAHCIGTLRGIGAGIASFWRSAPPGTITALLSDVLNGASEVEAFNARERVGVGVSSLLAAIRDGLSGRGGAE